jgi:hypothetical protein
MSALIDPIHFNDLAAKDPGAVCKRADCRYDQAEEKYTLTVWGEDIHVFARRFKIESMSSNVYSGYDVFHLFAIHYLLGAKDIEVAGTWISEKDVPGGPTFFRGPHRIPTDLVSNRFGNDLDGFKKRCVQLNGQPVQMADAAFIFQITSRIPVACLYWVGDDDFPAEFKLLYDSTISEHLATDIIYALAVGICQKLADL